VPISF